MAAEGEKPQPVRSVVNLEELPETFPTHLHAPEFWEELGRSVATFGFLEDTLKRAILAITGTTEIPLDKKPEEAVREWHELLEKMTSDTLGPLINKFEIAVKANAKSTISNLDELIHDLREASKHRNVICHGSWGAPDKMGRSKPFFISNKKLIFDTPVDVAFLRQLQKHAAHLAASVINTVTSMGVQFPGSKSPGKPIWPIEAHSTKAQPFRLAGRCAAKPISESTCGEP